MEALQTNPEESLRRIVFKLRFYREAAGVSQKEAAEKLNVGHRSYQRIEGGETNVDITFLIRFSQIFNVNFVELVTPYAPVAQDLVMYKTPEELDRFLNLPFVKEKQFKAWSEKFLGKTPDFSDCRDFTQHHQPMCLWTPSKKCMNDAMLTRLDIKKEFRKMNFYFLQPEIRLNFLDNLYYYRPFYSLKKIRGLYKNSRPCEVELYSVHHYENDDVVSFSFVDFIQML